MKFIRNRKWLFINKLLYFGHIILVMKEDTKPLNLDYLHDISSGDMQFVKDLIQIFLKQIPEIIQKLRTMYHNNEFEALAKEAHTAKSSVLIFGMEKTGILLKQLQLMAEARETALIPSTIQTVEEDLLQISGQLNQYILKI